MRKIFLIAVSCLLFGWGAARAAVPCEMLKIPSIRESSAYQKFLARPVNPLSRLLYLVDRFSVAKFTVLYDKAYYTPQFVTPIARWFLKYRYAGQTSEKWIMQYCTITVLRGDRIWVKLEDGKFVLASDILLDELKALDEIYEQDKAEGKVREVLADARGSDPLPGGQDGTVAQAAAADTASKHS